MPRSIYPQLTAAGDAVADRYPKRVTENRQQSDSYMDHYYRGDENRNAVVPPAAYGAVSLPMQPTQVSSYLNGGTDNPAVVMIKRGPSNRPLPPPDTELDFRWRGVWARLDTNNDGRISLRRLREQMLHVKHVAHMMPESVRETLMAHIDSNGDGYLEYDEFLRLVKAGEDPDSELNILRRIVALVAYTNLPQTRRPKAVETYLSHYSCFPPPIFMLSISAIEIFFYIYYGSLMGPNGYGMNGPVPTSSPLIFNPYRRYEAWRYLSYIFIHVGWFHLVTNVLVQLMVGIPLELVHKFWRLAVIYVCGIAAGALGTSLTDPRVFLAGASAGVYALMSAHLANIIINWREMEWVVIRLVFWLTVFTADVTYAVLTRYIMNPTAKVGYSAHFFGALMGILVGVVMLRNLKRHVWETVLVWLCAVLTVAVFAFLIVWSIVYQGFPRFDCSELQWPRGNKNFTVHYCSTPAAAAAAQAGNFSS